MKIEIERLILQMKERGIFACIVPTDDFHGSEYVSAHFKLREYLSGFTGSAGTLLVTLDGAREHSRVKQGIKFMAFLGIVYTAIAWIFVLIAPQKQRRRDLRGLHLAAVTTEFVYREQVLFLRVGKLNLLIHLAFSLWHPQQFGQPSHFPPQRDFPARLSLYIFLTARNKTAATTSEIITVDIKTAFQKNRRAPLSAKGAADYLIP